MEQTTCIVQLETRTDAPQHHLIQRNREYAQLHGYAHKLCTKESQTMPPYWQKVQLVSEALQRYECVLWIDSDAVVHDTSRAIPEFDGDMAIAPDIAIWNSPFNAGVFIVKHTAVDIIDRWLALYNPTSWTRDASTGKWTTAGEWANSMAYEQGAFSQDVLPLYRKRITVISPKVMQSPLPLPESWTLHFPTIFRNNMIVYILDVLSVKRWW